MDVQRAAQPTTQLSALVERQQTPDHEQPNLAAAASAPPKTRAGPWNTPSRIPSKPTFDEMHPSHAQTTAKRRPFAKRVGTASPDLVTPTKQGAQANEAISISPNPFSSPTFDFKFKRPSTDLSSDGKKLMDELRANMAKYRDEMSAQKVPEEFDGHSAAGRKIAPAKGKMGRFSDIHMKEFKKMNSIADHPSAWRVDPSRVATPTKNLKRTNSTAGLDTAGAPRSRPTSVKADTPKSSSDALSSPAKRIKTLSGSALPTKQPTKSASSSALLSTTTDNARSGIPAVSKLTTPTKASLARSASTKSVMTGPSKIPSLAKSPSMNAFSTPQPAKVTQPSTEGANKVRTSFANKLKGVKSILRRPQLRFSDDPIKLAAGTHVATPKAQTDKALPSVPEGTPGTPSNRAEKHVNFSPEPDSIFKISARKSSSAQPPGSFPDDAAETSGEMGPAPAYPTLPLASPSSNAPGDFTFRANKTISFSPKQSTTKQTTPTIRRVRPSEPAAFGPLDANVHNSNTPSRPVATPHRPAPTPVRSFDYPSVPHGLSNKKRKRESKDVDSPIGAMTDAKSENKENFDDAADEPSEESPKKKARVMTKPEAKKPTFSAGGTFNQSSTGTANGKPARPSTVARGAKGGKKGLLSMSRLNALARPKNRQ